jgi:hypothetical protein
MHRMLVTLAAAVAVSLPANTRAEEPSRFGFSIQGQLGAGQTTRDLDTDADLVYGAILGLHFLGPLGVELDYQHAENDVSDIGGANLKQDGVFGHVRFDLLRGPLIPFAYTGLGWVHYEAPAVTEDRLVIPFGVGLEVHFAPLIVGARGEYQWNTSEIGTQNVDYWKVVGTVGLRF